MRYLGLISILALATHLSACGEAESAKNDSTPATEQQKVCGQAFFYNLEEVHTRSSMLCSNGECREEPDDGKSCA